MKYIFISLILLTSCASVERASNKIHRLTEKFPSLIQQVDTIITLDVPIKGIEASNTFKLDSLPYNEFVTLRDSINTITLYNTIDSFRIEVLTECPDTIIPTDIPFTFPSIIAECNCKKEVRHATKELRKQRRRMISLLIILLIASGVYFGFKFKSKIPFL